MATARVDCVGMEISIDQYNAQVVEGQRAAGSLPTEEPLGARMKWGAWQGISHRQPPERSE